MYVAGVRAAQARLPRARRARRALLHLQLVAQDRRLQGTAHLQPAMGELIGLWYPTLKL